MNADSATIGILGGGQLGRMMLEACHRLNIKTLILDSPGAPAKQLSNLEGVNGSFKNEQDIIKLSAMTDVLTVEIEHVDCDALAKLEAAGVKVQPDSHTLRQIQDKHQQKLYLKTASQDTIPMGPFKDLVGDLAVSLQKIGLEWGYPLMLKSKRLAYDGRGNRVVKNEQDIKASLEALGGKDLYVEKWVPFTKELAVMVAKSTNGDILSYPCVETVQKDNICHLVIAPAQISGAIRDHARVIAEKVVGCFSGAGIFGVELFLLEDGSLSFNEVGKSLLYLLKLQDRTILDIIRLRLATPPNLNST